jgi:hypothetical protein
MKKLVCIGLMATAIIACTKEQSSPESNFNTQLQGEWELRQSTGGIAGTLNYPANNGNTIIFKSIDSVIFNYQVATVPTVKGTYTLSATSTMGDFYVIRSMRQLSGAIRVETDSVRIANNRLQRLGKAAVDAATLHYEKIK